jgi:hypothetical protein
MKLKLISIQGYVNYRRGWISPCSSSLIYMIYSPVIFDGVSYPRHRELGAVIALQSPLCIDSSVCLFHTDKSF